MRSLQPTYGLALGCIVLSLTHGSRWPLALAIVLLVANLLELRVAYALARRLTAIVEAVGSVVVRLVFAVTYAIVLVPLALLTRPFRRDAQAYVFDRTRATYWKEVRRTYDAAFFTTPW